MPEPLKSSDLPDALLPAKRRADGIALIEGYRHVGAALQGVWKPLGLLLGPTFKATNEALELVNIAVKINCPLLYPPERIMRRLGDVDTSPQVALALAPPPTTRELPTVMPDRLLILDGVSDPGNAGTLLRTARAFGATVILCGGGVSLLNEKFLRASAGTAFGEGAVYSLLSTAEVSAYLKSHQHPTLVLEADRGEDLRKIGEPKRWALVVGSEARGPDVAAWSGVRRIRIPMSVGVESLNAAVSGALALYELSRNELP